MHNKIDTTIEAGSTGASFVAESNEPMILSSRRCADGHGTLSYLFFSEEWVDVQRAKAICAKCTDSAECLQGALAREEPWGVWGGEQLEMGRVVAVRRPRGRPPTRPRAEVVVPEVPVPAHLVA